MPVDVVTQHDSGRTKGNGRTCTGKAPARFRLSGIGIALFRCEPKPCTKEIGRCRTSRPKPAFSIPASGIEVNAGVRHLKLDIALRVLHAAEGCLMPLRKNTAIRKSALPLIEAIDRKRSYKRPTGKPRIVRLPPDGIQRSKNCIGGEIEYLRAR